MRFLHASVFIGLSYHLRSELEASSFTAMENRWESVFGFVSSGSYPGGFDKSQRQNLRRYCSKFILNGGELFVGNRRVLKTKEGAKTFFREAHVSLGGHSGVQKTRSTLCSRFYWYGMTVDIDNWVLECDTCQRIGKPLAVCQPLQCIKVSAVWDLIGIDLTGPLPTTPEGNRYILTATDYFSKWVEAFPLKTKSAAEVGKNLCSIIYRHGCPKRILSDQGREFVNELNLRMCQVLGIERSVTAAYHPQTNGLAEKTNDNIKRALRKLVNDKGDDWDVYLDAVLFSLRSQVHTTTKCSPFLLMYGREAVFPAEVPVDLPLTNIMLPEEDKDGFMDFLVQKNIKMEAVKKTAEDGIEKSQQKQREAYAKRVQKKNKNVVYRTGDEVLLFNMKKRGRKGGRMEPDFSGPYTIKTLCGKLATLMRPDGKILKTKQHINHLKPYRRSPSMSASSMTEPVRTDQHETTPMTTPRPSVICFAPPQETGVPDATKEDNSSVLLDESKLEHTQEQGITLWDSENNGRLEAVVGPYKLFDMSFRTLQGQNWLSDEVIDGYLFHLIKKHQQPVHQLSSCVSSSLFAGQYRHVKKMKMPIEDTWLCPVNFGAHWMLLIVVVPQKVIHFIDPLGHEGSYSRKILRSWRNFLKGHDRDDGAQWQLRTLEHNIQQDSHSCGVLVLKFAEKYLDQGQMTDVLTSQADMSAARLEMARALIEYCGNAEEYCAICSMVEADANKSVIEMVQCDRCHRWTHFNCAQYDRNVQEAYFCSKCR